MLPPKLSPALQLVYGSLFFLTLILTFIIYWQGLTGLFIFDDGLNLRHLEAINESQNIINEVLIYTFEGQAGSLGRPLSMLTFAMQAHSWPFNPWDFKYVNLMLHLLNGCLIFWFLLFLFTRFTSLSEKQSLFIAFLTTTLWLLHPLQVSTVLYVIQRMTQLAVFFTLLGLLLYLYGRQQFTQHKIISGFFWVTLAVGFGGTLATLSKENGLLLVLYIIVLESTVLRTLPSPPYWQTWKRIFLYLPLVLLATYFLIRLDTLQHGYDIRDFTMGERLLTQTRVLIDYLAKILLLHPYDFGLYHDDFTISRDLLTPITTLFSLISLGIFLGIAFWLRRSLPILALGILWFFAGHILESSFIGLMLYFEHRNHLPMLGILLGIVYGLLRIFNLLLNALFRKVIVGLGALFLILIPLITWSQTDLWGKPLLQTVFWAKQNPHSMAAQGQAIVYFQQIGKYKIAEHYAHQMVKNLPQLTAPYLYQIELGCLYKSIELPKLAPIVEHFKTSQYDHATTDLLAFILEQRHRGFCQLEAQIIEQIYQALIDNPNNTRYLAYYYADYAMFYAFEKRYEFAIEMNQKALFLKKLPVFYLRMINWLIREQRFEEAQIWLNQFRGEMNPLTVHFYEETFKSLEAEIKSSQIKHLNLESH